MGVRFPLSAQKSRCKKCKNKEKSELYKKYPKKYYDKKKKRTLTLRNFILEYLKGKSCIDCGNTNIIVLEFDHVRGNKKDNISGLISKGKSIDTLKKEIDKCEIRCANCHRIKTAKTFGWMKAV